MAKDELMTRKEVMGYLRISHATLDKYQKKRLIPYIKIDRKKVLFRKSEIDAWLETKKVR